MSQQFLNFLTQKKDAKDNKGNGQKRDKFIAKAFEWINGNVTVTEEEFPNFNKAHNYLVSLGQCDCHVKIYDEDGQVVFSEKRGSAITKDPETYA